jgi:hypothetical protein
MEYEILESFSDEFLQKIQALLLEFHIFDKDMENKLIETEKKLSKHFFVKIIHHSHSSSL